MSRILVVLTKVIAILYIITSSPFQAAAHTNPDAIRDYSPVVPHYSKELVMQRLDNLSSVIDIEYTDEVGRRIKEYTVDYRVAGKKILGLVDLYFPLFDEEIAKRNLPEELKYVAVVESHLDITAKSMSGAVGLWQFIKSTATGQGLTVNNSIDERKDAVKSTRAALEYLSDLHDRFGDWTLAIAAYNCGPGGVNKAIRRSGKSTFSGIKNYLPRETQKYVPRIIAAMYLMQYYHEHNLTPVPVEEDLRSFVVVNDGKGHNLVKLAKQLDVEFKVLHRLNSQYINGHFPKNNHTLYLNIPLTRYYRYLELHDHQAYKLILEERKQAELIRLKEKQRKEIKPKPILAPAEPIERLFYNRVRQLNRQRKLFRVKLAKV